MTDAPARERAVEQGSRGWTPSDRLPSVLLQSLEQLHVDNARAQGWSWQQIAAALGVSRQAVHEKHGRGRRMFGPRR